MRRERLSVWRELEIDLTRSLRGAWQCYRVAMGGCL